MRREPVIKQHFDGPRIYYSRVERNFEFVA